MPVPLWLRAHHVPTDREAWVSFACLSAEPIAAPAVLDPDELGLPDIALPPDISVSSTSRASDPSWAELLLEGELRALAGPGLRDLDAMQWCHSITVSAADAGDLGYLQVAWALVRHFVLGGARVVFDEAQLRWFSGDEVRAWPVDRAFALDRELNVIADRNDGDWLFLTRGLVKFARPELVVRAHDDDAGEAERLLAQVARAVASGQAYEHDDVLETDGAPPLAFSQWTGVPELSDALVLSDLDGEGYVRPGVRAWAAARRAI